MVVDRCAAKSTRSSMLSYCRVHTSKVTSSKATKPSKNLKNLVFVRPNSRVQVFSHDGTFLANWGTYGKGNREFNKRSAVAVDREGNIIVADTDNHRIQVFSYDGTFLTKWGTKGSEDGQFYNPYGAAVDGEGNVIVADTDNNRIQVLLTK